MPEARRVLITGGAGFIGSNLVERQLCLGNKVTIFDALSRRGSEKNLAWLRERHGDGFEFMQGDVRDFEAVRNVVANADVIFHLAAQVAVTTSVTAPRPDFEINALGTLNVLEAARVTERKPTVVYTSTNKVYGRMEDVPVVESETRYSYRDLEHGVAESQPLDFHSPYGCSKGAGDQYVRDYARMYDMPTIVFRMSCIYGPHQFGNEDQGWLAYFMLAAKRNAQITIYGNGKQVRDVLFVDDLMRAFELAVDRVDTTRGQVYNIGGGAPNTVAVWSEFGEQLGRLRGDPVPVQWSDWRPGDQPCYVSDVRKAKQDMGWQPQVDRTTGVGRLWEWVSSN